MERETHEGKKVKRIFIACPWTPLGGGMFKVADYLIQSQEPEKVAEGQRATLLPLDTRGGKSALMSALYLLKAFGLLVKAKFKGDLSGVHINMAERLSMFRKTLVILVAKMLGFPVLLHLHAAQLHHFYAKLPAFLQAYTRWAFSKADMVAVLGLNSQEFVSKTLKVAPEKLVIITNGVPYPKMDRNPYSKTNNKVRVIFLGNLSERKGVSDLLEAIARSDAFKRDLAEAVFIGSGDVLGYQKKAAGLGVSGNVNFIGWADQAAAQEWMATADVLALPSYDEGLPLVILEALGNGVAVLCTSVGEIGHNLTNNQDSVFVSPGDIDEIAQGLDRLTFDEDFRSKISENGKKLFQQRYSLESFSNSVAKVHQEVFGVRSRPLEMDKRLNDD